MSIHENRAGRINCLLIAGGVWHDIDHARLELLKLLSEDERFRVRVFEDYENTFHPKQIHPQHTGK